MFFLVVSISSFSNKEMEVERRREDQATFEDAIRMGAFQSKPREKKEIGSISSLMQTFENKYIEKGYITTRIRLDLEKSDFEKGNISLFVIEGKSIVFCSMEKKKLLRGL